MPLLIEILLADQEIAEERRNCFNGCIDTWTATLLSSRCVIVERIVIACEPMREVLPRLGPSPDRVILLDWNLHRSPDRLRQHLQALVDEYGDAEVVLAMGLCGEGTVGLKSSRGALVVPRVDDCLALLRGSQKAHREQTRMCPGTYYLTKGWLDSGDAIVTEFERCVRRYGSERALRAFRSLFRHYRQVVFIELGLAGEKRAMARAEEFAERFGMDMKVVLGDLALLADVIHGRPNPHIARFPAGQATKMTDFLPGTAQELRGVGS
jgi:hypothetical protein